jgi:hypothetical protein
MRRWGISGVHAKMLVIVPQKKKEKAISKDHNQFTRKLSGWDCQLPTPTSQKLR